LDRFDIHCAVPPVEIGMLSQSMEGESSTVVAIRVDSARQQQRIRNSCGQAQARNNAALALTELERLSPLGQESRRLLDTAGRHLGLSARAFVRIYRVARTIADLAGTQQIETEHLAEAIQGRLLDRQPLSAR